MVTLKIDVNKIQLIYLQLYPKEIRLALINTQFYA